MEAVLLILLLVGVAFFAFGRRSSQSNHTSPSRTEPQKRPAIKRQPFDAQSAHEQPISTTIEGPAYVVDGDTIVIHKTQIRLFGVDAPELDHPHGKNAKWALVNLCKGKTIRAEVIEQDAYGRTVAKCHLQDGRDLSAEMVKLGFVRRQGFWHQEQLKLRESLAHLVCFIMRHVVCDASVAFQASFV